MKKSRVSSGEIIGSNESMLSLIFLRLPVKSLIRFKAVCKQWLSLVSDPYFANSHTITSVENNHSFLTPSGLFIFNSFDNHISSVSLSKTRKRIKPSLPSLSFLGHNFKILQSCNGLLLGRLSCGTTCVCNPTTRKFKILPSATVDGEFSWISPFTIAFDPSRSPNYRVVCFKRFKKELPESTGSYFFQIFMYLSETGFWKANTCFEVNLCSDMAAGIFSNGSIHWQCHEQYIRFDMNEEKVRLMTLPFVYWNHRLSSPIGYLGQWCDNVYSCIKDDWTWNSHELDQGTLEWTKKNYDIAAYRISRLAFNVVTKEGKKEQRQYDPGERRWSVLAIAKGENETDTIVLVAIFGKVFSYNFARRKVKIILDLGLPSDVAGNVCRNCLSAYQYIQTLSPV